MFKSMTQNIFLSAMYHLATDNEPQVMMTTRVDDLLLGETEKGAEVVKKVREVFAFGSETIGNCRYGGTEITETDEKIIVACKSASEGIEPIDVKPEERSHVEVNADRITQLKSITGSLSWIIRKCRPELA